MTRRKSKRDLERELEAIAPDGPTELVVVYADPDTGEWYNSRQMESEPIDEADISPHAQVVVIHEEIIETSWSPEQ